jgi:hypothetical protein
MIITSVFKEVKYKSFNRFSKFVLIGNNIDGFVNIKLVEFKNFEEVKKKLPSIINALNFEGEWNLSLYQIPDNLIIKHLYGYYIAPKRGKLILELTYMNVCKNIEIFITDAIIHVSSTTGIIMRNYENNNEITEGQLFEEYITVLLYEDAKNRKSTTNESYSVENF